MFQKDNYFGEAKYIKAKKRVKKIKDFYSHLIVYISVNIFLSGMIIFGMYYNEDKSIIEILGNFGVYSTWVFWGIGLFFHWLDVFGIKSFFSEDWEQKKIKAFMKEEEKKQKRLTQ